MNESAKSTERATTKGVVINGVRLDVVARLVGSKFYGEYDDATPDEFRIAAKIRTLGAKMERQGYLPAIRRQHMQRAMVNEAQRVKVIRVG